MSGIVENLKDPSWWFSAFFIAIVASVIAGFAKDRIGLLAASLSSSMKLRQEKRLIAKKAQIEQLIENETLLILKFIQAGVGAIFSFQIFIMFLLSPMWAEVMNNWCGAASFDPTCKLNPQSLAILASFAFGLLSVYSAYKVSSVLAISSEAVRAYRRKHSAAKKDA
ncbi:hypothetical protein LRS11_09810 [Pseudomonas sp. J452]|uniref:hypothetical protein n=1 Tax=Pseudomonas sp. J452 TaxID=2898441 RepID=UPI0021AE2F74|nr:hypothetical protein [Pseudomonas sp. J452]UUY10292.1 hypothetical protein LRS11_09810 [Pseudomonas sp. J452]